MSQGKGMLGADADDSLLGYSLRRTGLHSRSYDGLEHHLPLCLQHASQSGNQLPRATDHNCPLETIPLCLPHEAGVCLLHAARLHGTLRKGRL
jgi:hypothetical protein